MRQPLLMITFDDGFKTDLTIGLQEQLNRGMSPKGTSFIAPGLYPALRLSAEDQLELINNGWDIQCHSYNHPVNTGFDNLTAEEIHQEMQAINEYFATVLNLPPPQFHAYPGSRHNKLVRDIVGRYRLAMRTTDERFISPKPDWHQVPSFNSEDTAENLLPKYRWVIEQCEKHGLCASILFHALDTEDKIAGYTGLLDLVQKSNVKLVTFTEMYRELTSR